MEKSKKRKGDTKDKDFYLKRCKEITAAQFRMIPENKEELKEAIGFYKEHKEKIIPYYDKPSGKYHVKDWPYPEDKNPRSFGYLYSGESDVKIEDDFDGVVPFSLYGYHTYGGYYGFFRPDIIEVTWLMLNEIDLKKLENAKKIYVTTDMYPSAHISDCYDSKLDRHKALTTVYLIQ